MSIFDTVRLIARQEQLIKQEQANVRLWQRNAMESMRHQRELIIFFIHALDQADHDQLHDALIEKLINQRNLIAYFEEHIL